MASHDHLHPRQFGKRMKSDPGETKKPAFTGANASKTMRVDHGDLPHPPKRHPYRRHAGRRTRRAR